MKARLMAGVLAVVVAVSFTFAQEATTSVAAGSKAMLFSFNGLSNLGAANFNGGIGAKYYLSSSMALRAGLQFSTYSHDLPSNADASALPPEIGIDGSQSATRFGVNAAIEYHFLPTRVSPYVGAGVSFSTTSTDVKTDEIGTAAFPPVQTEYKNAPGPGAVPGFTAGTDLAVGGILGVEFFITKEISLGAEYALSFQMHSAPDQQSITGNTTLTTKVGGTNQIGFNAVNSGNLTLAVYF